MTVEKTVSSNPTDGIVSPTARPQAQEEKPLRQQFVSYGFYKADLAWRRLGEKEKEKGRKDFLEVVEGYRKDLMILSFSTLGTRSDTDFMLWKIGYELERLRDITRDLNITGLGQYLTTPYHYLAMTKRSIYVDKHEHSGQEGRRLKIVPGKGKYLFVYPFWKTHDWYQLPKEKRQAMMDEHIAVGHKYPSVRVNTTYSFGLDDPEFVVAFETDFPADFLDLVMELREGKARPYTLRDTPVFTCIKQNLQEILKAL